MNWLKSKTILFNMVLAAFGVLETADLVNVVPTGFEGIGLAVIGFIGVWLRKVTTMPLDAK
jgi:hypothetical protein